SFQDLEHEGGDTRSQGGIKDNDIKNKDLRSQIFVSSITMGSHRTKEDDVAKISMSIYITNFPETCSANDLFNTCKLYRHVMDAFIPFKRSKARKRFGFVRFINVFNVEILSTGGGKNYNTSANVSDNIYKNDQRPTGVGKTVKESASLANLKMTLNNEGFIDIKIQHMGEMWVMLEFVTEKSMKLFRDNVSVGSWFSQINQASMDFVTEGRIAWVELEETPGWVPDFLEDAEDEDQSDVDSKDGRSKSEEENMDKHDDMSEDPFRIYSLLKKKDKVVSDKDLEFSMKYPPSFTPNEGSDGASIHLKEGRGGNSENGNEGNVDVDNAVPSGNHSSMNLKESGTESVCTGHFKKSKVPCTGGSIMSLLDDVVKVGQVMGYKMDGCMSNVAEIIESQGVDETCWGNMAFDYVHSDSVGNSGGILCVWDPNAFCKSSVTMSDYFIMVRGVRRQNVEMIIDSGNAKVKWAIEGDENSIFFHGMLNKKRNTLYIRVIMVDGIWIVDPNLVKREFLMHFSSRFSKPDNRRALIQMRFPKRLSLEQQVELESEVSNEEINRAVWDCETNKAPGPDGFTFGFYRYFCLIGSLYKIIAKILANRLVGVLGDIVNEWCKRKKKRFLVFKVDFEKAYDSIRSSRGSIILNASPTEEFQFYKGLKQGDPLSLFLFILVMESLHLSFQWVEDARMFKGIKLGSSVFISHMFYADDAVFVGHWCKSNINTLVHALKCFYRVSGLRINMSKSKLMGLHVDSDKVKGAAIKLG
nr:RNA-directed DNA polymerase, eukaryota [Tanacetum cinerariifolium]